MKKPTRTARFHIRKTRRGEFRPYLKAANGEIVAGSETYKTLRGAKRWINRLFEWSGDALATPIIVDEP